MDIPPEIKDSLPGAGGSLTALLFFNRGWPMAIALFCCGIIAARYLGVYVAEIMGSSREISGYVTGLFAMAIIAKAFDLIAAFDAHKVAASIWAAVLRKFGG